MRRDPIEPFAGVRDSGAGLALRAGRLAQLGYEPPRRQHLVAKKGDSLPRRIELESLAEVDLERPLGALAQLERTDVSEQRDHVVGAEKGLRDLPHSLAL